MKQVKWFSALLALALVLGVTVSCAPAATPVPAATPAPETAGNAGGGTVDTIKARGKLVMLTNAQFPPFEYPGDDGKPAGVDVDIAQAIADELGVELEVSDMEFDGIIMAVQSGQGDLGIAGMTNTPERQQNVDFSINYVETTQAIIVREDSSIAGPADLAGKKIGVQMGTTGDAYASNPDYISDGAIQRFKTGPDAGLALQNGQIDAVVIDEMPAAQIASAGQGLKVLEEPLTEESYAIAIKKGNADLKAVVDKVLDRMLKDGSIDALIAKHLELSA